MTGWSWKLGRVAGIDVYMHATLMTPCFETAEPSEMLEGAFQRLQASACPALPVLQGDSRGRKAG